VQIHVINPLTDPRWNDLVEHHPRSSAFHQRGWLQALNRTYGYDVFALTSAAPEQPLKDAVVLCGISSWITGKRLVSLPFADHCDMLLQHPEDEQAFSEWLRNECDRRDCRYVELRPRLRGVHAGLQPGRDYHFHVLDLSPSLERLFDALHKDSTQRRIRHAEKEGVRYDVGNSPQYVDEFYRLMLITRRRHRLFPQPRNWFDSLVSGMGDRIQIWLARKEQNTVAAMLTLRHGSKVIYKYGCSDERYHNLGAMPFLFWNLIEQSKATQADEIDFGRSDTDNTGLTTFKDRFGARREKLVYYQYSRRRRVVNASLKEWDIFRPILPILPDLLLSTGGRLLYRHMG
jgi:Acetyltransferase (GNAT) domain